MAKKKEEGLDLEFEDQSEGDQENAQSDPKTVDQKTALTAPNEGSAALTVHDPIQISDEFSDLSPELQAELGNELGSDMEGVIPQLPLIRLLHVGALAFKMPDETLVKSFEGVIIDHIPANAWWEKPFDEGGAKERPVCTSLNGLRPQADCLKPQAENCPACKRNQYGTSLKKDGSPGRGKACKNMKRMAILLDGHIMPFRFSVPPSSIIPVDAYITALRDMKRPVITYKTLFGIEKGVNEDGIEYSLLTLTPVSKASATEIATNLALKREFQKQIRGQAIETEEYIAESNGAETASPEGAPIPSDDEAPPF